MNRFFTLSYNDFRMVFRDPVLKGLLFAPLIVVVVAIFVIPILNARFPAFGQYNYIVLMGAGVQAATMFGFINGFIFLEEKDEHVFMALKTVPVSGRFFLLSRLSLGVVIASFFNWCILHFAHLVDMHWTHELLLAFQFSLLAPILALAVAVFAKNKVEGLAQYKIYNLFVTLPLIIYFLKYKALHLMAILPTYWSFRSIEMLEMGGNFWTYYGLGWVVYLAYLIFLVRRFETKVF